ncbi:MAG TPA: ABC transporter permease [Candidatus Acidoferrales bacterium]|nr:ABC transporter permease [Candidatus Acidoferrales bacterium]
MTDRPTASSFWLAVATLWWRELVGFYRHTSRVVGALGTPVVFWLLIGSGIGSSFRLGDTSGQMNYLEYFFPGTVVLILLFTSVFTMMSVIEDRREGFLRSVLVAPIPRSSLVLGKTLGGATLALLQGLVFVFLAPAAGIPLGLTEFIYAAGALFLVALTLAGLGFLLAWRLDSVQGFHAVTTLVLLPLWLLSGALFPASGASPWIRWLMMLNPLTYAVALVRRAFYLDLAPVPSGEPSLTVALAVTIGFALATILAAFWAAETPTEGDWG